MRSRALGFRIARPLALVCFSLLGACKSSAPEEPLSAEGALVKQGERVYVSACIACHNRDPRLKGAIGPEVAFASLELLEARVVHGNFPEGYKPKMGSGVMPAMPQYKSAIPALHAYLNSFPR